MSNKDTNISQQNNSIKPIGDIVVINNTPLPIPVGARIVVSINGEITAILYNEHIIYLPM